MKKDTLGERMKGQYERSFKLFLPRRTYTIIRLDGKSFHSYTKGLERPFDYKLMADMQETAVFLCENIDGTVFAYQQSDEISLLLTDFNEEGTEAWFDNNLQKMVSVSASLATAKFNELRPGKLAMFDSRAFVIPDPVEVGNYFVWRQKDATRNSLSMLAQSLYSHKELHQKGRSDLHEICYQKGVNWNNLPSHAKRGTFIHRVPEAKDIPVRTLPNGKVIEAHTVVSTPYRVQEETLDFVKDRKIFDLLIPKGEKVAA